MVRGAGKFKTKRSGGKNFSRDMELDQDGIATLRSTRHSKNAQQGKSDEQEARPSAPAQPELTRAERRELKKKQTAQKQGIDKDDESVDLINPNHIEKKLDISDLGSRELTSS